MCLVLAGSRSLPLRSDPASKRTSGHTPRFRVGVNNSFIHGELLKGKRELDSALPAMASLVGIDPKQKSDLRPLCAIS